MKIKILLSIITLFSISKIYSQNIEPCGHVNYINDLNKKYPGFINQYNLDYEKAIKQSQFLNKKAFNDSILKIQVVFHIVYNTAAENLHDSIIYDQLNIMNACFRRKNADTMLTRTVFKPLASDAGIEFYLAKKDPKGKATNGINRVNSPIPNFIDLNNFRADAVKNSDDGGVNNWDPSRYLNIWVCDFNYQGQVVIIGYAYPPINAQFWDAQYYRPDNEQGIVMNYKYIGSNNPNNTLVGNDGGESLVHEIGHYFGLRHVWGDAPNQNEGCNYDDGLKDTPNSRTANNQGTCFFTRNTCVTDVPERPDMIENYMDYSPDQCKNMFTKQQVSLMRYNILNLRPNNYVLNITKPFDKITLYPNPFTDKLSITFPDTLSYHIKIYNALGEMISEFNFGNESNFLAEYNTGFLSNGLYYIKLYQNNALVRTIPMVKTSGK